METKRGVAFVALAVLMVSGGLWLQNGRAEPASVSYGVLQRFADGSIVEGSRTMLVRTDTGVTMTIHTSDLPPGAAHTVWWAIYNNPEHCPAYPDPCTFDDLFIEAVQGTSFNATGHVIGDTGVGNFAAHLDSPEHSAEAAELYWMALARDVPFTDYASHPLIARAAADLSAFSDFRGPQQAG